MFKAQLEDDLLDAVKEVGFITPSDAVISIADNPKFGDYSSNVALQLSKQTHKKTYQNPREIANAILEKLGHPVYIERIEVAGAGFLNFFIKDEFLKQVLDHKVKFPQHDQKFLVEYGHTNPLKEVHIGHLRTFILGESICRMLEFTGNSVFRANYQGDIGLHIAKAIWGIRKLGLPEGEPSLGERAKFMGQAYAEGNKAYEEDPQVKSEIDQININLYKKDPSLMELYQVARQWSLDYFEPIYELLGIKYDRCFFESEVYEIGKQIVSENTGKIFKESDGAIIFPGQDFGLHNRVFITSAGNPTYEGKEIGLAQVEYDASHYDHSLHVVANEQAGYFEVVFKAIELIFPDLKGKKQHLSYGFVDLSEGKMSSRTGQVITVDDLVKKVSERVHEAMSKNNGVIDEEKIKKIAIGAIKFYYLKYSPGPNIVFDLEQSVSLHGDSGVYVMYTYARANSILEKAGSEIKEAKISELEPEERAILRQIDFFTPVTEEAAKNYQTSLLVKYLLDLAGSFNSFYEKHPVLASDKKDFRISLTKKVAEVLSQGLNILGIEAPQRI